MPFLRTRSVGIFRMKIAVFLPTSDTIYWAEDLKRPLVYHREKPRTDIVV